MSGCSSTSTRTPRPHVRVGLFGATDPDRDGVHAVDMGRTGRRRPDDYTIATVPDLVKRAGDAMADLDSVAQSIAPLLDDGQS